VTPGEVGPQVKNFALRPVKTLCLHSSNEKRVFTSGGERRGECSPLGDNFDPGG
jgi:hypothetical protein